MLGASACIWHRNKVLLVLRGAPPKQNLWSLPGGLVEVGETMQQAAERELFEETGLIADILGLADWVEVIEHHEQRLKHHFVVAMFIGKHRNGDLRAGDDARAAEWFSLNSLDQLEMTKGTADTIRTAYQVWISNTL